MTDANRFLDQAIALARANIGQGGRPFGAVVVRDGAVIATGVNEIHTTCDPTAHAEMTAIRAASRTLASPDLTGCAVFASGHPCPMCLAAMHLCGIERAWVAYDNAEGEPYGLSTAAVYAQMARPPQQQSLPLRALKPSGEAGLYLEWKQANAQ